ncbi:MAG: SDR family NAD(P)-dependent oxidoreductase, partial [Flavobacteriales bacterium]
GISSVAGERGRGTNYVYGSAKAGMTAYLDGLRNYLLPKGVHVVTVKPGYVDTKMKAGKPTPGIVTASPEQVAKAVFRGYKSKKNTIYVLWMWRWIMLIIRNIPEFIFKRMKL